MALHWKRVQEAAELNTIMKESGNKAHTRKSIFKKGSEEKGGDPNI